MTIKNRVGAIMFAMAVLGAGAALLIVGFALLAALAVAGAALGAGVAIYRRLRGRTAELPRGAADLDPSLEVFPSEMIRIHSSSDVSGPTSS